MTTPRAASFTASNSAAKLASVALAALMTLGVLASLHTLADTAHAAAQQELAQSAASAPRS